MGRGGKKRRERKQRQAQAGLVKISLDSPGSMSCPLCREPVGSGGPDEGEVCEGCAVAYHRECVLELGGCATLGCVRRGQVPSEPRSNDPAWDRYRERVAAGEESHEAQAHEGADTTSNEGTRASRFARIGGKIGAFLGGGLGFVAGGVRNWPAGFDLSKGLQWGALSALAGAVYFGLSAGLIGRLGVRKEPVFGSEFFLLASLFAGLGLGGVAGSAVGAFGVGAFVGLPIALAISLRLFGFLRWRSWDEAEG